MKSFLQHIVDDLGPVESTTLKDKCYVFPSRRAAVYFNDLLQKKYPEKILWAPSILSIEEFIQQNAPGITVVDEIRLLFRLYEVYKKEEPHITFDSFYTWGQTLLNDFDEIDRYLVDAELLYRNLQEVEDIEATFGPSEEIINAIKGFKEVIDNAEDSVLWKEFSKTWATVGKVYGQFKKSIIAEGWAYNGLCYRNLAEQLQSGDLELPYQEVVFAGFNAISIAEEQIIDTLLSSNKAKVYIDADRLYLDNENEEAGFFLRKMRKHWRNNKQVHWVITDGFNQPKTIKIIGVSQKTGQAKAATLSASGNTKNTAIALADESLLMPVLYALPEQDTDLNITMGYPVDGTSTANLVKAFIRYQSSASTNKNGQSFFDIETYKILLNQPAITRLVTETMHKLTSSKSRYMSWQAILAGIEEADNRQQLVLKQIFSPANGSKQAVEVISQVILDLYLINKEDGSGNSLLEEKVITALVQYLQDLQSIIQQASLSIGFSTLEKLINESIKQLSTPFSGEPLATLQVMGFLETRALDFENLVVMSVNEDILPAAAGSKTYIPFGIRKAFKLPTFLEHNSIYAYHFFRLLQRATNISLIYNTKLSVTGTGEKSRFILQLLKHFDNKTSKVNIEQITLLPQLPDNDTGTPLRIEKTGIVLEKLNSHFQAFTRERPLSPTSLVDYITCSLKYYYARISRIREADEPSASIDARIFGNILHDILEAVYTPWIGKEITRDDLTHILKNQLNEIVDNAFNGYDTDAGEVALTKHIIHHLVKRIIQNDGKDAPLRILDLESKRNPLTYSLSLENGKTIPLGGKIDRLDQVFIDNQWVTRILDYKTGKFDLKRKASRNKELPVEDYMGAYFDDPKFKSGFQIYFYTLLHKRLYPAQKITGGVLGAKKISAGVTYLRQQKEALPEEVINAYEKKLVELINTIMDPDQPFTQTEDIKHCQYCEFKAICAR